MFFDGSKFHKQFLKGHTTKNLVKLFQILISGFREDFLRISSSAHSAKSPSPGAAMFFDGSKFREQFLKRVTLRDNPVKLFQYLTSGFRGQEF